MARHLSQPLAKGTRGLFLTVDTLEGSIRQNLLAIIFTEPGERFMRTNIGVGLRRIQWDPVDDITLAAVRTFIKSQVARYETRVRLVEVFTQINESTSVDQGSRIDVQLTAEVIQTNRLIQVSGGVLVSQRQL